MDASHADQARTKCPRRLRCEVRVECAAADAPHRRRQYQVATSVGARRKVTRRPLPNVADQLQRAADAGLMLSVTADRVVRLVPPLILSADEADQIVQILVPVIRDFLSE